MVYFALKTALDRQNFATRRLPLNCSFLGRVAEFLGTCAWIGAHGARSPLRLPSRFAEMPPDCFEQRALEMIRGMDQREQIAGLVDLVQAIQRERTQHGAPGGFRTAQRTTEFRLPIEINP